jgi:7-cyano-7-deazaguanine synthase
VLLSGGQDSTTCLLWALSQPQFTDVHAVSFDYGQRHRVELDQVDAILDRVEDRTGRAIAHHLLAIPALAQLAGASLTSDAIPTEHEATEAGGNAYAATRGLPSSFVPGRNTILVGTAAALAGQLDAQHIVCGICAMDRAGYPDCRAEYAAALETALRIGLDWPELSLHTPLLWATKADTWRIAADVAGDWGVQLVRVESHTCYEGDREQLHSWGFGCGECPACQTRQAGWFDYIAQPAAA